MTTETLYVFLLVVAVASTATALDQANSRPLRLSQERPSHVRPWFVRSPLDWAWYWALWGCYRGRSPGSFVGLVALVLIMTPWVMRNAIQLGAPVVTSTESGYVLWQGNSPEATGGTRGYVDTLDFTPLDLSEDLSEVERDAGYRRRALRWMADNPGQVVALAPKKLWNMWRPTYEGASTINNVVTYATYLPLLIASLIGLYRARRHQVGIVLLTVVGYHLVVHGLVPGMIRFRLPVEAFLLASLAGLAVARRSSSPSKDSTS